MNKEEMMHRCLELALEGAGFVSPNPLVGAVIVAQNGNVVGEGKHQRYGDKHAEVNAIADARKNGVTDFSGATLFINLEPCCHQGKQPPCLDAIFDAKIPNVVVGMLDPNPLVSGKGIASLRERGVSVEVGVLEADCRWINRYFCYYITEGMPYIVAKVAQSLDGCIATKNGDSKYITCEESRRRVHILRSDVDAVLVGVNTILKDNPLLDTRLLFNVGYPHKNPKIVILDTNLRTPPDSNIFQADDREVLIICGEYTLPNDPDVRERKVALEKVGAKVIDAPEKNGRVHLRKAISLLALKYNFTSLLSEGGSEVFSSLMTSNMINELQLFVSPQVIGNGKHAFENFVTAQLSDARCFKMVGSMQSGKDEQMLLINETLKV